MCIYTRTKHQIANANCYISLYKFSLLFFVCNKPTFQTLSLFWTEHFQSSLLYLYVRPVNNNNNKAVCEIFGELYDVVNRGTTVRILMCRTIRLFDNFL